MTTIPRGKYIGRVGDPPKDDAEHFHPVPGLRRWIDCRDLGQVFQHEGPLRKYGCPSRRPQLFWLLHPQPSDCSKKHVWQIFSRVSTAPRENLNGLTLRKHCVVL
jgi:hypothetical protein